MARAKKTGGRKTGDRGRSGGSADATPESTNPTATAVAGEALRTGVVPLAIDRRDGEGANARATRGGGPAGRDPGNTSVGDEGPGGSMASPDNNRVDAIGRAMGVQEADAGELRASSEILDERDKRRAHQEVPDPESRG